MKKIVLLTIIVMLPIMCLAEENWDDKMEKNQARNVALVSKMEPYSCFEEITLVKADLPWDKAHIDHSPAYVLIKTSKEGILYLQPSHTSCEDTKVLECKTFWLRSWRWKEFGNLWDYREIKCPKYLTKKFIKNYVQSNFADELVLSELP